DQGIECGQRHANLLMLNPLIRRCGGASVGAGLTHQSYIGTICKVERIGGYSDETVYGHDFKTRARETVLRKARLYDTGAAACDVDACNFGQVTIEDCHIVKG